MIHFFDRLGLPRNADPDKLLKRGCVKMGDALMLSPLAWKSDPLVGQGDWIEALEEAALTLLTGVTSI